MYGKTSGGVSQSPLIDSEERLILTRSFVDSSRSGNCYSAANQTGCVWSVGLHKTNTGLCLANPIGSGKILSILAAGYSEIVAPTGEITDAWLAGGYHASTDVALGVIGVARNLRLGGSVGAGKVYTGATLPSDPVYLFPIMTGKTDELLSESAAPGLVRIDGLVQVTAGGFVIIANFTIGVAVGAKGAIIWEEIDV